MLPVVDDPCDMLKILRWPDRVAARRLGVSINAIVLFRQKANRLSVDAVHSLRQQYEGYRTRRPGAFFT